MLDRSGKTAETVVPDRFSRSNSIVFGCVGCPDDRKYFILFQKFMNAVHEHTPQTKLCFNPKPGDTVEAVLRWT